MKCLTRIASLGLLLAAMPALAQLTVSDAYLRAVLPGAQNTAAYMTLRNTGDEDIVLTGAASPIAGSVMVHETVQENGMMHMRHVMRAIVPAGGELKLQSGGMHLMLMQLVSRPASGDEVVLTLEFADGTSRSLALPVRSVLDE